MLRSHLGRLELNPKTCQSSSVPQDGCPIRVQAMSAKKVLISGDPQGNLAALFKRAAAVNKSNGPFDMLLCVGSFFEPAGTPCHWGTPCTAQGRVACTAMHVR